VTGRVFVVSAPSGTGKTTLNRRLMEMHPDVAMSVSYTTRKKRPSEVDGVDYHFVSEATFRKAIHDGEMLEYAEVFDTLYGTPVSEIHRLHGDGKIALLEIDVQGWRQAREKLPGAKSVFILPPSIEALWQRLESRGTEPKDVRWRRLMTARSEISSGGIYDHFIVNRDLDVAFKELQDIIIHGKSGKTAGSAGVRLCHDLLNEFDRSPLLQKLSRQLADK
jgi:guanylate kinase